MARLHSDLGQRTVYLPSGIAKAQNLPCVVYKDPAGAQVANLAEYDAASPATPGAAISGAAMVVDAFSNRPAFWDLDDLPVLYISVAGVPDPVDSDDWGPLVPILPDAQPLIDAAVAGATAKADAARVAAIAASIPRTPGKNLFDPLTGQADKLWNGVGSDPTTLPTWTASPKYPVSPGQTYSISNCRNYEFFNSDGSAKLHVNNPTEVPVTFTVPAATAYLAFTVATTKVPAAQLELGAATAYEPYGVVVERQIVGGRSLTDSVASVSALERLPGVVVFRAGTSVLMRAPFDATRDLLIPMTTAGGEESQFQFANPALAFVSLIPASTPDSSVWPTFTTGTGIHGAGDDNAPINTQWSYIGGNHGWTSASTVTATGHGKTTADLGSTWSDGTRTYTLLAVPTANTLLFGHPYTVASSVVTGGAVAPAAPLTHVSGATNTTTVPIAGGVAGATQIHPASFGRTITVELDGRAVPDGKSAGQLLTVTESYSIASYKGMVDWAQANVGTPVLANLSAVPVLARVSNTYRISGVLTVIAQKVTAVEKFAINMGVTQAFPIALPAGGSRRMMLGGVGTVNGVDYRTFADLTSISTQADIGPAAYLNPSWPATTMTQWAYDSGGNALYGFAMGILPVADGHPTQRLKNAASKTWFFPSSTKKSYPQIAWNRTLLPGESLAGMAYRRYLVPPDTATGILVPDGSETWVVVERPTTVSDARVPAPGLLGRRLVPVGPTAAAAGERVTGEGVTYSVASAPGWGMWRATAEPARLETLPGATAQVGVWFVAQQGAVSTQAPTGGFQTLYLWPMYLPDATPVDRVAIEVTTLGTGVLRHGIYGADPGTGQPAAAGPLYDFGTVDATSTGIKESTIAAVLPAGWHWYGQVWQVTNTTPPTIRVTNGAPAAGPLNIGSSSAAMTTGRYGYYMTGVAGALGALSIAATNPIFAPRVAYRRA